MMSPAKLAIALACFVSFGFAPQDSDGDGVDDPFDDCPFDPTMTVIGPCGCNTPPLRNLNLMLVGDSHTIGEGTNAGYRLRLESYLLEAGYDVNFLGNSTNCGLAGGNCDPLAPLPADLDHEGHRAFRINNVEDRFRDWVEMLPARPDAILLMIGSNDVFFDVGNRKARLIELVGEIFNRLDDFANWQDIRVVLSTVPPLKNASHPMHAPTVIYNEEIADPIDGVVALMQNQGHNIVLADNRTYLEQGGAHHTSDPNDDVHLNQEGYDRLASAWMQAFPPVDNAFCFGDGGDQLGCTDCPCGNNAPPTAINCPFSSFRGGCLNAAGQGCVLFSRGVPSVNQANDTLHFEIRGALPETLAILISGDRALPHGKACPIGTGALGAPPLQGLRCVGRNMLRHGARNTDGNGHVGVDPNEAPARRGWGPPANPQIGISAQSGFVSGQTRYFQCVYRDMPLPMICPKQENTSNGVKVTFVP